MCRRIYSFLDSKVQPEISYDRSPPTIKDPDPVILQSLEGISHVWTGEQFIQTALVAHDHELWNNSGPYLYCTPAILSSQKNLVKALKIKDRFSFEDVKNAVARMKKDFRNKPVNDRCQNILKDIVSFLQKLELEASKDYSLMLPDEKYVLHLSKKLVYNDVDWAPKDPQYTYVNNIVPIHLAKQLSVQPARSKIAEKFVSSSSIFESVDFGPHEEITLRIQNILRDYPFDITVLKELLQNADDAGASKMYFILDQRTHGTQEILSKNWEMLQGPALLVWNDSEFSEKDLEGIQKLGLGSKRSDAETIGQYGIGFNVVYHLTDCPSFITGGETMCILDPHCMYVHEANKLHPGTRYDELIRKGFWESFSDMSSAYLQSGLDNCPSELQGGTLFRFPLRTTKDHLVNSKIVQRDKEGKILTECVTSSDMFRKLSWWVPQMKEAMLFLNHVNELQFMVIEDESKTLTTKNKYCAHVENFPLQSREVLQDTLSSFNSKQGNRSTIVRYQLTISDTHCGLTGRESLTEEKWLIQQGVGDIDNERQIWHYVDTVKPRHGIAAPIPLPKKPQVSEAASSVISGNKEFVGRVFCFLPLPEMSNLPVHINGNFILDSTRRNLWKSKETEREDDLATWNNQLFQAIASSYANLLEHAQTFYVSSEPYKTWMTVNNDVHQYYGIFPGTNKILQKPYRKLVESVYDKLVIENKNVLAVVSSAETNSESPSHRKEPMKLVSWHPPKSSNPSTQIYFWSKLPPEIDWKKIKDILEELGMKITCTATEDFVKNCLNDAIKRKESVTDGNADTEGSDGIKSTSPETVFDYYCKFCVQASHTSQFPCPISASIFKDVTVFKLFTGYLLNNEKALKLESKECSENTENEAFNMEELVFPNEPFGHPLLLTADSMLRRFNEDEKVIRSNFSHLFPNSPESFLHPDMTEHYYSKNYFVYCSILTDNSYSLSLVNELLSKHLPSSLKTTRLSNFPPGLSKDILTDYWKCFVNDSMFRCNRSELLKSWALLPSVSGSLHSSSDTLVPVVPFQISEGDDEQNDDDPLFQQINEILRNIGMPFLDVCITNCIPQSCPDITDHPAILKAMFHLNEEKDVSETFGKNVEIFITYLIKIDFRHTENSSSLAHVKTLPLFECVDDTFRAIEGKTAFVWPFDAITIGFSDWCKRVPNVLFLKENSCWELLGRLNVLGINTIAVEELYCEYIFANFSVLDESIRYQHLTYIRKVLFPRNQLMIEYEENYSSETRRIASSFLMQLKRLHCIGGDYLRPIRDFCDHTVPIFVTFSRNFLFLPDFFKDSWKEWQDFFKKLGLKHIASKTEFQQFCWEVAKGEHENPTNASSVLLEYLYTMAIKDTKYSKHWLTDTHFLNNVGCIPFVTMQSLPQLTWIKKMWSGFNNIVVKQKQVSLTKLNEAAICECGVYLWTVKPIIKLPAVWMPEILPQDSQLAKGLGITCTPAVADVVENIRNIADSVQFTDFSNFDQYPNSNQPPDIPGTKSLMTIMKENFLYLERNQRDLTDVHIQFLKNTPCIPVYSTFDETISWQVVLVEPRCVLQNGVITTNVYHPYLHALSHELFHISLLKWLGVESDIGVKHIQYLLEKIYECSNGQVLTPKSKACVLKALTKLFTLLSYSTAVITQDAFPQKHEEALHPLYLPNEEGKLALSTNLLYVDNKSYKGKIFPTLEGTGYSVLKIRGSAQEITFYDDTFCDCLPENVRPVGLSTMCSQTVLPQCEIVPHLSAGKHLIEIIEMNRTLAKAFSACMQFFSKSQENLENVSSQFLSTLTIRTVNHLRVAITFKETNKLFGNLDTKFFLDDLSKDTPESCLYLDSTMPTDHFLFGIMIKSLASRIIKLIKKGMDQPKTINKEIYIEMLTVICELLNAHSFDEIQDIMDHHSIPMSGKVVEDLTFTLGKEVPECWHHRLDQSVDNVFHPGEIVGYEVMENHIIYASIMHPILPEGIESFDKIPRISMRYMILTRPEDEQGTEVSVLKLYKFLTGLKKTKPATEGETDVVPYEGEAAAEPLEELETDVQQICSDLKRQLDEIWQLSEEDRKKAIRRLLLKWHPDKNLDNQELADEVFKFLISEIARRNASHEIHWQDIDREAQQQREYYQRERSTPRTRSASTPWFNEARIHPKRNPREGIRWLKQAQANFSTLQFIHLGSQADSKVCGDVCFMAHQVAEKALKGGKYFVCGLDDNSLHSHNLTTHAYGLQSERPGETHGLAAHTAPLENYYLDPRYPNCWPPGVVPADQYSVEQAEAAKSHAQAILDTIRNIVENDHEL